MHRKVSMFFNCVGCVAACCLLCSPVFAIPVLQNLDIWGDDVRMFKNSSEETKLGRTSKVLNFFPVPVEEECNSLDGRRKGLCMNTYECRIQGGASSGLCALGFGVCCIFTATCGYEVINNITYFINPDFPDLSRGTSSCELKVKKIDPEVAQLRLDFIHFHLVCAANFTRAKKQANDIMSLDGQPNRRTGVCDDDVFLLTGAKAKDIKMCGLNSGQHVYYDVEDVSDFVTIRMSMNKMAVPRIWEVRILQMPFTERAPVGCLQYHTGSSGIIQTLNFAENGRRLADQDYNICMRQEYGMCSIAYEPCHENSFRVGSGPRNTSTIPRPPTMNIGENSSDSETNGQEGGADEEVENDVGMAGDSEAVMMEEDAMDVGSGDGETTAVESAQMMPPVSRQLSENCPDRIILPCESDDLLTVDGNSENLGFCDIAHCGSSLCPAGQFPCRVESNLTPFTIGVHFQAAGRDEPPDDNLGMCLRYEQLPCT